MVKQAANLLLTLNTSGIQIKLPKRQLLRFFRSWKVSEFALFGSVLRQDFSPGSDIDVLITFLPEARWSLFDLVTMQAELEEIFERPVDLVEKDAVRNPYRRRTILENMRVVYAAPKP